jgi:WD40 repeat protein
MRLPIVVLLILLWFATTFSQAKPIVEDKGNFGLHVVNDAILRHQYLERENQLLLIGYKNLQLLDLTTFKVIDTRPIDLPFSDLRGDYDYRDWPIGPDGRRMVLLGLKEARTKTKTETKQAAWVLDLQTGKRIALLDHPDRIRRASWSKNGKTLVTMDASNIDLLTKTLIVGFWDGETFEYRHSMALENVTWIYLSNDGRRFFAASGKPKNLLGVKYVADSDSVVRIWKTETGELEKTISVADAEFHPKTREIEISPDERFLVMVNKHKSVPSKHRLLAWEINGGIKRIYELQPQPKIDDSRVVFSPDGSYFALDVGKNLQIYETKTGKLQVELTNVELPSWGWLDNGILASVDYKSKSFFEMGKMLKAFDANDGRLLFKQRLAYDEAKLPGSYISHVDDTVVVDDTTLRPHPTGRMFLTSSNQFAKIFESRTGELLQTVVHPLIVVDIMGKPRMTHGNTVLSADWSKDGKALYVFSANRQSVSLWKLIED